MAELLKPPNTRGEGWSKVALVDSAELPQGVNWAGRKPLQRVVVKTQWQYYCRPLWNGLRKTPLVRREQRALKRLGELGVAVPVVLHYSEESSMATLITSFIEGAQPFDEALNTLPQTRLAIVGCVAELIARLHRSRWVHGALYPAHILVTQSDNQPHAHLIDLEKAKYRGKRQSDLDRFWRYAGFLSAAERKHFEQVYEGKG